MEFLIRILPLSIILLMILKERWAIYAYLAYVVLLFGCNITLPFITLTQSSISIFCFIIYIFKNAKYISPVIRRGVYPFIFYFMSFLLIMPFQNNVFFDFWRLNIFEVVTWGIIIYTETLKDTSFGLVFRKAFIGISMITVLYGFVLFFLPRGLNPYRLYLQIIGVSEYLSDYSDDINRSMGRIFSTWSHPLYYNFYLGSFFLIVLSLKNNINKALWYAVSAIILFNILTSGVRTTMVVLIPCVCILFIKKIKLKTLILGAIISISAVNVVYIISDKYSDYLLSIVDSKKSESVGSNMDMRLEQLEGSVDCIKGNPIFGNGYNWTDYYKLKFGAHPKAITFESLIFVIIADSGLIGFFIWIIFIILLIKLTKSNFVRTDDRLVMYSLIAFFITFTIITGLYSCMTLFILVFFSALSIIKARSLILKK